MSVVLDKISSFPDTQDVDSTMIPTYNKSTGKNEKISVGTLRGNLAQVQPDWNQQDSAQADYIKNKPDPSSLGLLSAHTDFKTLDYLTVTTPPIEEGGEPITLVVATRDNIPIPPIAEENVLAMFTPNVAVRNLIARRIQYPGMDPYIRVAAEDNSNEDNPLVLTVERGFGSLIDHTGDRSIPVTYFDGGVPMVAAVTITPETQLDQSVITIPPVLKDFEISYWNGSSEDTTSSYWVDVDGIYHKFTAAGTPLSGLISPTDNQAGYSVPFVIEGVDVDRQTIVQIVFGDDYNGVTAIPVRFLSRINRYVKVNLRGLKNVTTIASAAFGHNYIDKLDLSMFTNLRTVGWGFGVESYKLVELQIGSVDWSTVGGNFEGMFLYCPNTGSCILRADSAELAAAFKSKCPAVSNWTVVINS